MKFNRILTHVTDRIFELPVLVLMPHSRCNCRCVMCDIWKGNQDKKEITVEELEGHLKAFRELNVRRVALSGGEALMHSNLWKFCALLRSIGIKISLLSTGLGLKQHANDIIQYCDDVIVSLDGPPEVHNSIRNIPHAFERLAEGVKVLKAANPRFRVTGRTVIQKLNYNEFPALVRAAKNLGLDQISFLGADVSSNAFNRPDPWDVERAVEVALSHREAIELTEILTRAVVDFRKDFEAKFIAESPDKLLDIARYYVALSGQGNFPSRRCNAPWVSAVVESNGDVLPCFFHPPYGNLYKQDFREIINSPKAVRFRRELNISKDLTCQRCVCSLHVGVTQSV